MKQLVEFVTKYSYIIGATAAVISMAILFWASKYFVTLEEYKEMLSDRYKAEDVSRADIKEINLKLNVIIEGQKVQQAQFAAQNVLNEQLKDQYKDLHERLKYLERESKFVKP